ncbi:MAG: hypothetical protein WA019_04045 [Candidatus Moraniibacteriota bacterium]
MLSKKDLDQETQSSLSELLSKDPQNLLPEEIAFLHARKQYLTAKELETLPEMVEVEEGEEQPIDPATPKTPGDTLTVTPKKEVKKDAPKKATRKFLPKK